MTRKGAIKQYSAPIRRASSCHRRTQNTPQNKPRLHLSLPACLLKKWDETHQLAKKWRGAALCLIHILRTRQLFQRSRCTPEAISVRRCACTSPETTFKINSTTLGVFAGKWEKSVTPCGRLIIHSLGANALVIDSSLNNYFVRNVCSGKATLAPGALHGGALHIYSSADREKDISQAAHFLPSPCGHWGLSEIDEFV